MNAVSGLPEDVAGQLKRGEVTATLFYSRRTAETFVRVCEPVLDREARMQMAVLCLSEAVAAPLVDAHFVRVGLAQRPDEAAMMGLALSMARDHNA
jgi:uroporphyrinogen-III synthase